MKRKRQKKGMGIKISFIISVFFVFTVFGQNEKIEFILNGINMCSPDNFKVNSGMYANYFNTIIINDPSIFIKSKNSHIKIDGEINNDNSLNLYIIHTENLTDTITLDFYRRSVDTDESVCSIIFSLCNVPRPVLFVNAYPLDYYTSLLEDSTLFTPFHDTDEVKFIALFAKDNFTVSTVYGFHYSISSFELRDDSGLIKKYSKSYFSRDELIGLSNPYLYNIEVIAGYTIMIFKEKIPLNFWQ